MRVLIFILFLVSSVLAGLEGFDGYTDAAKKVEKKQIRVQANYLAKNIHYSYQFFPVTMFPFFCSKEDSLGKYLEQKTVPVYLQGYKLTIRKYADKSGILHLIYATQGYTQDVRLNPVVKTYTLYFFKYNPDTKDWDEERDPVIVSCTEKDKINGLWTCH